MSHINVSSTHPNSTPATRKRNSHVSALTPPNGSLSPTSALVSTPFRRKIKDIHFGGRKNPTPPVGRFRYLLQVKEGETLAELSKRMYDKLDTAMATDRDPAKKRLFVYDNCETTFKSITQKIDALTADNLAWREEMANKCLTWKHSLEDSMDNKMTTWKYTQACLRLPLVEGNTKQAVVKWAIGHQELWHHIKGLGVRGDDPTHSSVSSKHREIVRLFDDPKRFKDASSPAPNHLPFAYDPYFKSLFANCQTVSSATLLLNLRAARLLIVIFLEF